MVAIFVCSIVLSQGITPCHISVIGLHFCKESWAGFTRPGFLSASDAESQSAAYTYGVNRESMVMQGYTGYYHYDGRGSVANITGLSGETMVSYIYTDFGVDTAYPGAKNPYRDNPYRYNGERLDYIHGAPDLQFLRARYYDAASGRFTSRDTYWGKINVPLSQNLYTYTMNNPVKYADPSGHYVEEKQAYLDQIASLNEQISSMQNAMYNSGLSTRSAIQDELDRLNRSLASSKNILAMIEGQMSYQQAFPKQDRMIAEAESASARVSCESDWKDFFFTTDIALGILASLAKNLYSSFMFYPELMEDFVNSMSGRNSIGGMLNDFNSLGFVEYDGGYAIEEFYRQYAKNDLKFYAGSALGDVITIIGGYATTVLGFATVSVGADGQIANIVPGPGTAVAIASAGVAIAGTAVAVEGTAITSQGMQNLGHSIDRIKNSINLSMSAWDMPEGGSFINGREYSQHALERMAPDNSSVRAELTRRAEKAAKEKGLLPGTKEYSSFIDKYVDPRNIPPSVVEDVIQNTTPIPGKHVDTFIHESIDLKVIVNSKGKVISVIPK